MKRSALVLALTLTVSACTSAPNEEVQLEQTQTTKAQTSTTQALTTTTQELTTTSEALTTTTQVDDDDSTSTTHRPIPPTVGESHPLFAMSLVTDDFAAVGLDPGLYSRSIFVAFDGLTWSNPSPEPCALPQTAGTTGINTSWRGGSGTGLLFTSKVMEGQGIENWPAEVEDLVNCDLLPMKEANVSVEGATSSVVLGPAGSNEDGVSSAVAFAEADGRAVYVWVSAREPDNPALDVELVAELAARSLARRDS